MAISNKGKLDGVIKTLAELFQHCSICHPSKTLFAEVTVLGVVENCIDEPIIFRLCSRKGKDKVDGQHHSVCLQHSVILTQTLIVQTAAPFIVRLSLWLQKGGCCASVWWIGYLNASPQALVVWSFFIRINKNKCPSSYTAHTRAEAANSKKNNTGALTFQ